MVRERERQRGDLKHLSVHQWIRFAIPDSQQPTSPIGFLFLKLPPPPCAVLLVCSHKHSYSWFCRTDTIQARNLLCGHLQNLHLCLGWTLPLLRKQSPFAHHNFSQLGYWSAACWCLLDWNCLFILRKSIRKSTLSEQETVFTCPQGCP